MLLAAIGWLAVLLVLWLRPEIVANFVNGVWP